MHHDILDRPAAPRRLRRTLLILLAVLACSWVLFGQQLAAPYLDTWLGVPRGTLTVIAPGQWYPTGGILSPDGRLLWMGWVRGGVRDVFVLDLETGQRYPFPWRGVAVCWVSPDQIALLDMADTYFVIQPRTGQATRLGSLRDPRNAAAPWVLPLPQISLAELRARWQAASRITAINAFSNGGYTVFTEEANGPQVYFGFPDAEVAAILAGVPHTLLTSACNTPPYDQPLVSPDGRYYARIGSGPRNWLRIFTQDGTLVAEANKAAWTFSWMGWAPDSSALYFYMESQASMLTNHAPYAPVYQLAPQSDAEVCQAQLASALRWLLAGGVALAGVAGWRRWRRRGVGR